MFSAPGITFQHHHSKIHHKRALKGDITKASSALKTDTLAELVDIFPTLTELAGIKTPPLCPENLSDVDFCTEGQSLAPVIWNISLHLNSTQYSGNLHKLQDCKSVVSNFKPKTAAFSQYPRPSVQPQHNSDQCRLEDIKFMGYSMRTDQYRYTEWVEFNPHNFSVNWTNLYARELYLHSADSEENYNVGNDSQYASLVSKLSKMLHNGWRYA